MANRVSQRMVRAFERFNADLNQFLKDSDNSALYEDAFTSRQVRNFRLTEKGLLSWEEDDTTAPAFIRNGEPTTGYQKGWEYVCDDDEANDYLKFWRACLRRAKRYWSMDAETLDAIQEGEKEDIEVD